MKLTQLLSLPTVARVACLILFVPVVSAQTVFVTYGGDYVSVSTDMGYTIDVLNGVNLDGLTGDNDQFRGTSGSAPVSLTPSSGYSGPAFSGRVGTFRYDYDGTNGQVAGSVVNAAGTDRLSLMMTRSAGTSAPQGFTGFVLFEKSNFLNGGSAGDVTISFHDSASLGLRINGYNAGGVDADVYYIVNNGGNYYVSSTSYSANSNNTINPYTETWRTYANAMADPSAGGTFFYNPASGSTVLGSTFSDIRSIGFLTATPMSTGFTGNVNTNIQTFDFSGVAMVSAVPEPSTYALAFGLASLGLGLLRRRRLAAAGRN